MPTPFFGIGAMRAGTTWLSEVLESLPDCRLTPFKELHFFDVRYGKYSGQKHYGSKAKRLAMLGGKVAKQIAAALAEMRTKGAGADDGGDEEEVENEQQSAEDTFEPWTDEVRRLFFRRAQVAESLQRIDEIADYFSIRDLKSYAAYLRRNTEGAAAFGEISPAYGMLPAAAFAEMDGLFPEARFIFIMRDPVDRLWSHVRYKAGKANRHDNRIKDLNKRFRIALERPNAVGRSSYHHTIEQLESVIPAARIHYLFTEKMTSPKTGPTEIRKLQMALELEHTLIDPKFFADQINASPPGMLEPDNEVAAQRVFAPVYAFVEQRFGRPDGWRFPNA